MKLNFRNKKGKESSSFMDNVFKTKLERKKQLNEEVEDLSCVDDTQEDNLTPGQIKIKELFDSSSDDFDLKDLAQQSKEGVVYPKFQLLDWMIEEIEEERLKRLLKISEKEISVVKEQKLVEMDFDDEENVLKNMDSMSDRLNIKATFSKKEFEKLLDEEEYIADVEESQSTTEAIFDKGKINLENIVIKGIEKDKAFEEIGEEELVAEVIKKESLEGELEESLLFENKEEKLLEDSEEQLLEDSEEQLLEDKEGQLLEDIEGQLLEDIEGQAIYLSKKNKEEIEGIFIPEEDAKPDNSIDTGIEIVSWSNIGGGTSE